MPKKNKKFADLEQIYSMIKISERGKEITLSPIRKLAPLAEAAQRKGVHVHFLNIGQPDIPTPEIALNAVKNADLKVLEYSHSAGNLSFRTKLVEYYSKFSIGLSTEDIIITSGGSEAILIGFLVCLNPGDEVLVPEPFYANYISFAKAASASIKTIPTKIEDNFALPPISTFENYISDKTKAIMLCNPGNPTGKIYSRDELEQLKNLVKKHDMFLFADEVYREFCYDQAIPFSVMQLEGVEDNVILIDSISKRYSMCGARIGTLISRNKSVIETALKFAQARLSPPTYGQIAGEAALDVKQEYFDNVKNEYIKRRDLVCDALSKMKGVVFAKPAGAFYIMAKLPVDSADKFCKWLLTDFRYNGETVMLAPGNGFYSTPGMGEQEVRMAYVLNQTSLTKAMTCLQIALEQYPGKTL